MKKSLLLLALLSGAAATAQAQTAIPAGTVSLGGGIGFFSRTDKSEFKVGNNTFTDESRNSLFQFEPAAGYFFADNLALGLNLSYAAMSEKITRTGPGRTSPDALDASTILRVGPYVQYYKMLSDQFGVLGTLGAGYQSGFAPSYSGGGSGAVVETKTTGGYVSLTPGVIFFPVPKFGISASIGGLGYDRLNIKRSDDADGRSRSTSNLGASFGLSELRFGGTYFFGR